MSDMVQRVAKALREDDAAQLTKLKEEVGANLKAQRLRGEYPSEENAKLDLDCRELCWFKETHGWVPPERANIDKWLMAMREHDEAGTEPDIKDFLVLGIVPYRPIIER